MSSWRSGCDAIIALLQAEVPDLAGAVVHRYAAWSVEELAADGKRHLACWPISEAASPLSQGAHELAQTYRVLVWEDATRPAARRVDDEARAAGLLDLADSVRNVLYHDAHQHIDGSERSWYSRCDFPELPGQVQWFAVTIELVRYAGFAVS